MVAEYTQGIDWDRVEVLPQASPAAGVGFSLSITNYPVRLVSALCTFTASAVAANRSIELDYVTGDGLVWKRHGGAPIIVASDVFKVCWNPAWGMSDFASNGGVNSPLLYPLDTCPVPNGHMVQINVNNINATDAITAVVLVLERLEP